MYEDQFRTILLVVDTRLCTDELIDFVLLGVGSVLPGAANLISFSVGCLCWSFSILAGPAIFFWAADIFESKGDCYCFDGHDRTVFMFMDDSSRGPNTDASNIFVDQFQAWSTGKGSRPVHAKDNGD